jgi:hypothetical protein
MYQIFLAALISAATAATPDGTPHTDRIAFNLELATIVDIEDQVAHLMCRSFVDETNHGHEYTILSSEPVNTDEIWAGVTAALAARHLVLRPDGHIVEEEPRATHTALAARVTLIYVVKDDKRAVAIDVLKKYPELAFTTAGRAVIFTGRMAPVREATIALKTIGAGTLVLPEAPKPPFDVLCELSRDDARTLLARLEDSEAGGRAVPTLNGRERNGLQIFSVQPGSLFAHACLRNADTLLHIQGLDVSNADERQKLITSLEDVHVHELLVEVSRRTTTIRLLWILR